jgi:hypothetical protein
MTPALEARLRRADPTAYVHVDAVVPVAESSKRTAAHWAAATGSGFDVLDTGGVRLTGTIAALVEHTVNDDYLEDLVDDGTAFAAARILWGGAEPRDLTLERLKLYLHPRVDGGQPQEVARWRVRLYGVSDVLVEASGLVALSLMPLGDYLDVTAGASAGLVTFDFTTLAQPIRPKTVVVDQSRVDDPSLVADYLTPTTFVFVTALTSTGAVAGNVGLGYDTATAAVTTSGNAIASRELIAIYTGLHADNGSAGGCPRMAIETSSFTAATATFEDAGNRLDLGAVPTGRVEFLARGEVPPGTSLTFEVRNDADSAWVAFTDGAVTTDLSGVGLAQTYKVRVTLTPDAGGDTTPIARLIGVREVAVRSLANLTTITGPRWAVDPRTLKGEIGEARLTVLRDGEPDFRDAMTELLVSYNTGALTFEVFIADAAVDRADWLHVETFVLEEPFYDRAGGIILALLTPLARLRQALPRPVIITTSGASLTFTAASGTSAAQISRAAGSFVTDGYQAGDTITIEDSTTTNDGSAVLAAVSATVLVLAQGEVLVAEGPTSAPTISAWVRRPYEQANQTLEDVWTDLMDVQLALLGRMRGPGVEDDTTQVSNSIADSDAKDELDAIAALAGGGNISSQGQVKFVSLFATTGLAAAFPSEEITVLEMTPGLRYRVPESFVDYDWDALEERFRAQVRGANAAALTALGEAYIEPARLDDRIAKWIAADSLAQTVADRDVRFRATGIPTWRFRSTYAYPELEPGDVVAVETERFVLRDPVTTAGVRGRLWALGILTAVEGCDGRDFTVWIRQFADFLPAYTTYDLTPTLVPTVEVYLTPVLGNPGQLSVRLASALGATISYVVQDWGSAIPAYGAAAYQTYTAPFQLTQFEDLDRQLVVYAERSGLRSERRQFRLDRNTDPSVEVTLSEPTAGTLRIAWIPDDDVVFVRVYRKKNGAGNAWPTTTNDVDGPLDPAELVATKYVRADGGEFDTGGAAVGPGGTTWEETGYVGSDVAKVIVVPFRTQEHVGDRATASYVMAGSATASITTFSPAQTAAGSSCVAGAQVTVSWSLGNATDGNHDLKVYRRRDGGEWTLVKTEASPVSTTSYVDTVEDFEDAGSGVWYNWQYKAELVDTVPTVLDTAQADPVAIESTGLCPLS